MLYQIINGIRPLKASIVVASLFALAFSGNAVSAKAPAKPAKDPQDLSYLKDVIKDGYFSTGECNKYIEGMPISDKLMLRDASTAFEIEDMLIFVYGGKSATQDIKSLLNSTTYTFNPELAEAREFLKDKPDRLDSYSDEIYSKETLEAAILGRNTVLTNLGKTREDNTNPDNYLHCMVAGNAVGLGVNANHFKRYVEYVGQVVKKATIGHFEISAPSFNYGPTVGTGNRYAEPKKWPDSRFFIVNASFKNLDTESRLPVEGSLFINYNGKDYEFDSVEPIMLEGYNIWLKQINPLITMKTKIVYRIPNEIHGEVFWRPGRNPSDTKLWLGFIETAKTD